MTAKPDLNALLGSRICHDLISPIGAIGNGVELLMMDGRVNGPEIALISESVANANARIRFFRIAFGSGSAEQRISRAEVQSVLSDLTRGGRLTVDWSSTTEIPRSEAKLVFLLIQCLESAMAYGGKITVLQTTDRWELTGHSHKMRIDPDLWEVLSNPATGRNVTAAQVQFLLVPEECAKQKRRVIADIQDGNIRLEF